MSILEDSHGNLWFGTDGGGVSKYDGETFTHFTEKEGLSNNICLFHPGGQPWQSLVRHPGWRSKQV